MTISTTDATETELKKEQRLFKELASRLVDTFLNRVFDLRPEKAKRRSRYIFVLFFASGIIISFTNDQYSFSNWTQHIQNLFIYLFNPEYARTYTGLNPFVEFIFFVGNALFDPRTLRFFPLFVGPFYIALQSAAYYLADVFELDDKRIARKFVKEVALTGSDETIQITKGYISDEHLNSPNFQIGGPGKVIVDLDSVALFEKPDGTPHIIGPTGKEPGGKATLEGFERFRQALNLRDHFTNLRNQDDKSRPITGRSLDGIPVSAIDVQMMYSIYRDNKRPTEEMQYPFSKKAVEQLVYTSISNVTPEQTNPSKHVFIWENAIPSLVRSELSKFISEKKLTEFLASFGKPEVDKANRQENIFVDESRGVVPSDEPPLAAKSVADRPPFVSRNLISSLFSQFAKKFTGNAQKNGVELRWVGIGTWKIPNEIAEAAVTKAHFAAWKLTQENIKRSDDKALENILREAELKKLTSMIQNVPLAVYQDRLDNNVTSRQDMTQFLLQEYQRQLNDNLDFQVNNKRRVSPVVVAAITYIYEILFPPHHGPVPTPSAKTARERELYNSLMLKIGVGRNLAYKIIERIIALEREYYPTASPDTILEIIINEWDKDITQ